MVEHGCSPSAATSAGTHRVPDLKLDRFSLNLNELGHEARTEGCGGIGCVMEVL